MRGRILLAAGLATVLMVLTVRGAARADGEGHFCDANALCMSMDGTSGDLVYGKPVANDNEQKIKVYGTVVCRHGGNLSDYVQWTGRSGDTENCPFSTVSFDHKYVGDEIVHIVNYWFDDFAQTRPQVSGDVYQNSSVDVSGVEWIEVPGNTYVNVLYTDQAGYVSQLCDTGSDHTLVSSIFITGDACQWSF